MKSQMVPLYYGIELRKNQHRQNSSKFNRTIMEREAKSIHLAYIYMTAHSPVLVQKLTLTPSLMDPNIAS